MGGVTLPGGLQRRSREPRRRRRGPARETALEQQKTRRKRRMVGARERSDLVGRSSVAGRHPGDGTGGILVIVRPGSRYRQSIRRPEAGQHPRFIALGLTVVLIAGGFDMSVGAVSQFTANLSAGVIIGGFGTIAALSVGIVLGILFGIVNAFLVVIDRRCRPSWRRWESCSSPWDCRSPTTVARH